MKKALLILSFFLIGHLLFLQSSDLSKPPLKNTKVLKQQMAKGANALCFVPNQGQVIDMAGSLRPDILYTTEAGSGKIYLRNNGLSYVINDFIEVDRKIKEAVILQSKKTNELDQRSLSNELKSKTPVKGYRIDVDFAESNDDVKIIAESKVEGLLNFYYPHCSNGITGVGMYNRIMYRDLYENIDLIYYGGKASGLKYDLIVKPKGNVNDIKLVYKGADEVLVESGKIRVRTALGEINEWMPKVYQLKNNEEVLVNAEYILTKKTNDEFYITFKVGAYDNSIPLIIDPWMSYYGGSANDHGISVTNDLSENVIFSGITSSLNFPTTTGAFQTANAGFDDAFVVSMQPNGTVLNFATYYGGSFVEYGFGVCTDAFNNIIFCGDVGSANFPIGASPGYFVNQAAIQNTQDGYIVKLNSSGVRLFATFCGGNVADNLRDVCTDAFGNIIAIGLTSSGIGVAAGGAFQPVSGGSTDAYIIKLLANGTLSWGTYCGGSSTEEGFGVSCDKATNAIYFTGVTTSLNFPVSSGHQMTSGGGDDAYLIKLSSSGALIWSTFYGGTSTDFGSAVEVDGLGNVVLGGQTEGVNPLGVIATSGSYQQFLAGSRDAFVVKFNSAGIRQWATFIGGSTSASNAIDHVTGIGFDPLNNIVVGGNTYSFDFPTTPCAYQSTFSGNRCIFICTFAPSGSIICSSYLGISNPTSNDGSWLCGGGSISVYGCHIYLTGYSTCNFPTTAGAYQTVCGGSTDACIAQLSISSCGLPVQFPVSINVLPSSCVCNGAVTTSITSGCKIPPYSYFYSNSTQTLSTPSLSNTASNFCAGPHTYTVATMCDTVIGNFMVLGTSSVGATIQEPNCFSASPTGTITINSVANSTPNYTIVEGATTIASNVNVPFTFSNVSLGSHTYVITGSNACVTTFTVNIQLLSPVIVAVSPASLTCGNNTINLNASTTSTGVITYTWTGPSILSGANTLTPSINMIGNYLLTWQQGSCTGTNLVNVVTNTISPLVFASVGGTVTCNTPTVVLTGTSNISSANYSWSPQNVSTNTVIAIGGGNYTLTVTDPSNNCSSNTVVVVFQNTAAPSITAVANSSITCTNTIVGIIGTSTTSGVTYSWSPTGSTSPSISVTSVGIHTLTITDPSNGCKSIKTVTAYEIGQFSASVSLLGNVKCNGASTGSVELDLLGGSGIYSVSILNTNFFAGIFTTFPATITTLAAGNNSIAILDTLSGCTQTVFVNITQPPPLNLLLTLTSQPVICEGEPVNMYSTLNGGVRPYTYQWLPIGGFDSTLNILAGPSSYTLLAYDANSCLATAVKNVTVNLKPQIGLLNPSAIICGSICVNFSLTAAQNSSYVYNWNFTDVNGAATPIQVNQYNPTICFTQVGKYNCDVSIFTPEGCSSQSILPTFIKLYPKVKAAYVSNPADGIFIFDDVNFINASSGADWFSWYDENNLFSTKTNPTYNFYEPGKYLISLIASNEGCSDTLSRHIVINEATYMHFPNTFTPNNDGLNDVWRPVCYGLYRDGDYELSIFDRWGKRVFWTIVIDNGWDGTFKDKPCEVGVYNWRIKLKTPTMSNDKLRGVINLIR
jgi:gliding motility-associated-like protein